MSIAFDLAACFKDLSNQERMDESYSTGKRSILKNNGRRIDIKLHLQSETEKTMLSLARIAYRTTKEYGEPLPLRVKKTFPNGRHATDFCSKH